MITAMRYHDISASHRVAGHENKCRHLHGHNYRIWFTCEADELDSLGRVVDFGVIKEILCNWVENNWDHQHLIWAQDRTIKALTELFPESLYIMERNPTAENMASFLGTVIGPRYLPDGVRLIEVKIDETRKCSATWKR